MNMHSPAEIARLYSETGAAKTVKNISSLCILGVLAGFLIGMGALVTNTATHAMENAGLAKVLAGMLFPFGLGIIMLMGAELFTGNCMIPLSVLDARSTCRGMLKNWVVVFTANFAGAGILAYAAVACGHLGLSDDRLALYTIRVASIKCSLPFINAVILGILCNLMVCLGVLCSLSAKDTTGRMLGAYTPVAFFVMGGFEHSVANMYYIPAGLFALNNPSYAATALEAGVDTTRLTWEIFLTHNLLPVTLGNILAGAMLALLMWYCYLRRPSVIQVG